MVYDIAAFARFCHFSASQSALLAGEERPGGAGNYATWFCTPVSTVKAPQRWAYVFFVWFRPDMTPLGGAWRDLTGAVEKIKK